MIIQTDLDLVLKNAVFLWSNNNQVEVHYSPVIELNNQDSVFISGINTSIPQLTSSFNVGV